MKRRTMLGAMGAGLSFMLGNPAQARDRKRERVNKGGNPKKMLVIFQRGGNDGLNTLIPAYGTQKARYRELRPNIYLRDVDQIEVPGTSFFGLHNAMAPMQPLMDQGMVTWFHAVGYPNPNRSHFESQAYLETGVPGNDHLGGWLNRYLEETTGPGLIRGVSIGNSIPQIMSGRVPVPVSTNFGRFEVRVDNNLDSVDRDAFRAMLNSAVGGTPTAGNEFVYDTSNKVFQIVDLFAEKDANTYNPGNNAVYPDTWFGYRMRHAAQMLRDTPEVLNIEVATIDQGGYDTHASQVMAGDTANPASRHAELLNELARSIAAFVQDMGPNRMEDMLILVVSEFGRRAYQNDSLGTDHGTGSLAFVVAPNSSGAIFNDEGNWPGLEQANLYHGDLAWRTDFRDIYWEILSRHLGASNAALANILPGHTYTPLNFL